MKNKFLLSASCFVLCLGTVAFLAKPAAAQEMGSLPYYTGSEQEPADLQDWRVFLQYQLYREQCQNYQKPPAPYVMRGCKVYREGTEKAAAPARIEVIEPAAGLPEKSPTVFTVYFGVDQATVTDAGQKVIDNAASGIKDGNAPSVTVSGYTSTTGSDAHNQALSERRAEAVAGALEKAGVGMKDVTQKAYGETHLAVPTGDNVEMPANRRAVIEFRQ